MGFVNRIETKIATYLLIIPFLLFCGLLLGGCVSNSPGVPNLHLIQLQVDNQTHLRIGYYGLCMLSSNNTACVSTAFTSQDDVAKRLKDSLKKDDFPDKPFDEMIKLQDKAFLNVFAIAVVLFLFGLLFNLLWLHSTKRQHKMSIKSSTKRRRNFYRQFTLALIWAGSAFVLSAAIANTQTGHACTIVSGGTITTGKSSLVLHWTTWAVSLLFCASHTLMQRSKSDAGSTTSGMGFGNSDDTFASGDDLT